MSYRKIEVDGVVYEYTVGRTHVKFRGGKAVSISEIGQLTASPAFDNFRVTPGAIREYIQTGKVENLFRPLKPGEMHKDDVGMYE